MFKLAQVKTIKWPVDVQIPLDGGRVSKQRFTAEFEILPSDEYSRAIDEGDVLDRVVRGWSDDVQNEAGEPLPFSEEAKAAMLKISYVRVALLRAYLDACAGKEAARKN